MNIEKLTIKNFKNYMGEVEFDLSKEVILLYGANGFGKSSFFDAIEWCLTGKINRFDGSEYELKYDIANKRIINEESFEVAVTLSFNGNTLIRYFNITNGIAGNLQVRIISNEGHTHIGQEQIESFLKSHTETSITYDRGSFSQLLKQAYILSQEQVTDFITGDDAKERYKALANIMGLKSILMEFDNFKKVLKGLENNKSKLHDQVNILEKAILDKSETMLSYDEQNLVALLEKNDLLVSEEKLNDKIEKKIVEKLKIKNSIEKYLEFFITIEEKQKNSNLLELKNNLKKLEFKKNNTLYKKKKSDNLIERIDNKIKSLSYLEENLEKVNRLKKEVTDLQTNLNELNVKESTIIELNERLELLRNEKVEIEYNLNFVEFEKNNKDIIENNKKKLVNIKIKIEKLNNKIKKNNHLLEKVIEIIDTNKDKVLARLISGIKDVQSYANEFKLKSCPVCSSEKNNLSNDIQDNLNYYINQLNEESYYYEKVIKLSKYIQNRKQKLNNDINRLQREQNEYNNKITGFEIELFEYKSSSLFNENLVLNEQLTLEEKLANIQQELNKRQKAVEIILNKGKILSNISDIEKTSNASYRVKNLEEVEESIKRNNSRKEFVNIKNRNIISSLKLVEEDISNINSIIIRLQNLIKEDRFNQSLTEIYNRAIELLSEIDSEVAELNFIKELLLKREMNNSIVKQINDITEKQVSLKFNISKLTSYLNSLKKEKEEKQNIIGNGIADFLNTSHSTVQRYFRYLNPIPSNSELIFEGDEEQLNIKVAYNKDLFDSPGGKSNAKNILSSGQLNVLAISVFLAINKEQQIHSLNFVGIDDPIQNMDDINQYTMCDVLNSIEKQLIISTHDMNFLKLFIKKNEHRKNNIIVYNLKSPYISAQKLDIIKFDSHRSVN